MPAADIMWHKRVAQTCRTSVSPKRARAPAGPARGGRTLARTAMKKSDTRRQAILATATAVFSESGFDRASMSDISARMGCSKATLYSYFGSKEALFLELVEEATEAGL